jgi:hypothetical protein
MLALPFVGRAFAEQPQKWQFKVVVDRQSALEKLLAAAKENGATIWTSPDGRRFFQMYDEQQRMIAAYWVMFEKHCLEDEARLINSVLQLTARYAGRTASFVRGGQWERFFDA